MAKRRRRDLWAAAAFAISLEGGSSLGPKAKCWRDKTEILIVLSARWHPIWLGKAKMVVFG